MWALSVLGSCQWPTMLCVTVCCQPCLLSPASTVLCVPMESPGSHTSAHWQPMLLRLLLDLNLAPAPVLGLQCGVCSQLAPCNYTPICPQSQLLSLAFMAVHVPVTNPCSCTSRHQQPRPTKLLLEPGSNLIPFSSLQWWKAVPLAPSYHQLQFPSPATTAMHMPIASPWCMSADWNHDSCSYSVS